VITAKASKLSVRSKVASEIDHHQELLFSSRQHYYKIFNHQHHHDDRDDALSPISPHGNERKVDDYAPSSRFSERYSSSQAKLGSGETNGREARGASPTLKSARILARARNDDEKSRKEDVTDHIDDHHQSEKDVRKYFSVRQHQQDQKDVLPEPPTEVS
jgi:hypothetical protein